MNPAISELTAKSVSDLDEIYEFVAYSNLAFKLCGDAVTSGMKLTAVLPPLNRTIDQTVLKEKLDSYGKTYLVELGFQLSVSAFETWLFDLLRVLLSDPRRLNKKRKIDVADIVSAKSLTDLTRTIIDAELNEIRYRKPADWFEHLSTFVNIGAPSVHDIEKLSEIKASRDILVHNNGIANQIYLQKSGTLARVTDGERISIGPDYWNASWNHLRDMTETVGNLTASRASV